MYIYFNFLSSIVNKKNVVYISRTGVYIYIYKMYNTENFVF